MINYNKIENIIIDNVSLYIFNKIKYKFSQNVYPLLKQLIDMTIVNLYVRLAQSLLAILCFFLGLTLQYYVKHKFVFPPPFQLELVLKIIVAPSIIIFGIGIYIQIKDYSELMFRINAYSGSLLKRNKFLDNKDFNIKIFIYIIEDYKNKLLTTAEFEIKKSQYLDQTNVSPQDFDLFLYVVDNNKNLFSAHEISLKTKKFVSSKKCDNGYYDTYTNSVQLINKFLGMCVITEDDFNFKLVQLKRRRVYKV